MNFVNKHVNGLEEMKILHGFTSGAGQPPQIARAQRDLGFHSVSMHIGANKMGFEFDRVIDKANYIDRGEIFSELINEFNVFHFYAFPLFGWKNKLNFPFGIDLLLLKLLKLPVIMNFRGSEVRQKDLFDNYARYSFAEGEDHGLFKSFPSEEQRKYIELCKNLCTKIIVPDAELASYVPGAKIIPRAIDINKWKNYGQINSTKPLIVHAPTRRHVKGTSYILKAVDRLKEKGLKFDFRLVEGLSNEDAAAVYARSDIIIDQLKIGWHGVLSTEAMALGKVAMCYIREDLVDSLKFDGQLPLINVNEDTLEVELESIILNSHRRIEIGNRARTYVERTHALDVVAKQLINLYSEATNEISSSVEIKVDCAIDLMKLYCTSLQLDKEKINSLAAKISRLNGVGKIDASLASKAVKTIERENSRDIFLKAVKYEAAGERKEACVEYEKLLKHPDSIYSNKKYLKSKLNYLKLIL